MMDRAKRSNNVFQDFEWMEKMDEFDRQVEQEMWEEEFIRSCIEQLLDEEDERETMTAAEILEQMEIEKGRKSDGGKPQASNGFSNSQSCRNGLSQFSTTAVSNLNPNAAVFVPRHQPTSSS